MSSKDESIILQIRRCNVLQKLFIWEDNGASGGIVRVNDGASGGII